MPNWCENYLRIDGNKSQIDDFKDRVRGDDKKSVFSLNSLVPMPKDIFRGNLGEDEREEYGERNWYEWSIKNWGTKWDVQSPILLDEGGLLAYEFITAWSPPVEWLRKVSSMFPKLSLTLEYEIECGMGSGKIECKDGKLREFESEGGDDNGGKR